MKNILFVALCLVSAGCISTDKGNVISGTSSVIGIDASGPAGSSLPHVRIGFVREQFHIIPTSTNGPINSVAIDSSINLNHAPFRSQVAEDFRVGAAVTNAAPVAQAVATSTSGGSVNGVVVVPARASQTPLPK